MKNKIISVALAAVLSVFTVLATVMSASAAEGAVVSIMTEKSKVRDKPLNTSSA